MSNPWGSSWGSAWGNSWGSVSRIATPRIGAIGAFAIGAVAIGAGLAFPAPNVIGAIGRDAMGTLAIGAQRLQVGSAPLPPIPPQPVAVGLDAALGAHAARAYRQWLRRRNEDEALALGRSWLA